MKLYFVLFLLSLSRLALGTEKEDLELRGHLKPIGYQGTNLGGIPEIRFSPSGQYFYEHFVRKRQPVLVRNAAKHWLATKNWKNESYLRQTYGDVPFNVNMQKNYQNSIEVRKTMKLGEYLDIYKTENVYLDSAFPPTNMVNELNLPPFLQCGELSSTVNDIFILMNSGNASCPLHQDGYENILVVLSGVKKVILFNSSYADYVYADDFDVLPGFSPVNVSGVDLKKYPKIADIHYYESSLHAGDLVYIPEYWWHYVNSYECPNIGINIWFSMFDFQHDFEQAGLSDNRDVVKITHMFDELVKQQPNHIECKDQNLGLDQILKVVLSDTSAEPLRIPKTPERPTDFKLASGYTMAALGFGTAGLHPQDRLPAILAALDAGYRLFDTAQIYGTEPTLAEAVKQSNIPRSNITIVTKLHPMNHGYQSTIDSVEKSLQDLQTDYIDVFLIHTKECNEGYFKCPPGKAGGVWQDSWRAMEHLHKQGKIRSLGVSNFDVVDLNELLDLATEPVSVLQNWFDPLHQEMIVRQYCAKHGIHFMGYSTLGSQWTTYGGMDKNPVLTCPAFLEIASHHQFIVSQVILRWAIHLNVTVIPRSRDPRHIVLNFKALDIALTDNEIKTITEEYLPVTNLEEPGDEKGGDLGKLETKDDSGGDGDVIGEKAEIDDGIKDEL